MDFQLPLSGSPAGTINAVAGNGGNFQLPLSGSHRTSYWDVQVGNGTFQLPLSGSHTFEVGYDPGLQALLSTPSLGITEPDSGIFRLSAAFCRGTPSHK